MLSLVNYRRWSPNVGKRRQERSLKIVNAKDYVLGFPCPLGMVIMGKIFFPFRPLIFLLLKIWYHNIKTILNFNWKERITAEQSKRLTWSVQAMVTLKFSWWNSTSWLCAQVSQLTTPIPWLFMGYSSHPPYRKLARLLTDFFLKDFGTLRHYVVPGAKP